MTVWLREEQLVLLPPCQRCRVTWRIQRGHAPDGALMVRVWCPICRIELVFPHRELDQLSWRLHQLAQQTQ